MSNKRTPERETDRERLRKNTERETAGLKG